MNKVTPAFAALLAALSLASCSFSIPHADGTTSYFGHVRVNDGALDDSPVVHVRRYGVAVDSSLQKGGVLVGMQDRLVVRPPDGYLTEFDYQTGRRSYAGSLTGSSE